MYFSRIQLKSAPYLLFAYYLLHSLVQPVYSANGDKVVSQAIASLLASPEHPFLMQVDFSAQRKQIIKLYKLHKNQLLWLGKDHSEKNLQDALLLLANVKTEGLNPFNYDAQPIEQHIKELSTALETEVKNFVSADLALSAALLQIMHDLYKGRLDPHSFNYPLEFGSKPAIDTAGLLLKLIAEENIATLPDVLAPKIKQYQQLKLALADLRQQDGTSTQTKVSFAKSLHPGDIEPQVAELRQRLMEMGEMTAEQLANIPVELATVYDEATIAAVTHLQQQQGLQADGLLGRQTLMVLNQTPAEKINLIDLAMERLRWLPDPPPGPLIMVNIPAFQLWAFHSAEDENALNMKVVVGKAQENKTPILWEQMRYLEFMPNWNIPRSIMDKEIRPKIAADGSFLARQDIHLIETVTEEEVEEAEGVISTIKHVSVRAMQKPGKKNPLGKVKFIFPNKADVYLHDTPALGAFNRDRRDLSHGCVRVAEAEKLAEFVLSDQEGWDKEAISQAMSGPKTQRVSLKKSIPVVFYYNTAVAGQDNKLRFYPDIYGYDQLLQDELHKATPKFIAAKAPTEDG